MDNFVNCCLLIIIFVQKNCVVAEHTLSTLNNNPFVRFEVKERASSVFETKYNTTYEDNENKKSTGFVDVQSRTDLPG